MNVLLRPFVGLFLCFAFTPLRAELDFFNLGTPRLHSKEPRNAIGVWQFIMNGRSIKDRIFQPSIEIQVTPAQDIASPTMIGRIHFFDEANHLIATSNAPSKSGAKEQIPAAHLPFPPLLRKGEQTSVYFAIPDSLKNKKWKAVLVIGDKHEIQARVYPPTESLHLLAFPEKDLLQNKKLAPVNRSQVVEPLVERTVVTGCARYPQFTLFLRPPKGVTDSSEIKGVMAVCMTATGVDYIRQQMQMETPDGDYGGTFAFADQHKLAVMLWGVRNLWEKGRNFDEFSTSEYRQQTKDFDQVADAWERCVVDLSKQYPFLREKFLLWGASVGAQWAHRLCLRKPDYFLAVHVHIPSSFDKPTPEARKVMWLLTTGELEGGYEKSKRFLTECQNLHYPIVYKAYPGLGHLGHRDIYKFGFQFFEYALSKKDARITYDKSNPKGGTSSEGPWFSDFEHPAFYADIVNQEVYTARESSLIPAGFRLGLPSKEIADTWQKPLR